MKGIKIILLGFLLVSGLFLAAQDTTITFKFNNYMVVDGTPKDTLIFEIEAKANVAGTYLWGSQIVFNFNTAVFGTNIATTAIVTKAGVLQPYPYTILKSNSGGTKLLINIIQFPPITISNLATVPTSFDQLIKVKMLLNNASGNLGVNFDASLMNPPRQVYALPIHEGLSTGTAYDQVIYENNLTDMPPDVTNLKLMLSEIGDPSNTTTNFVEIYNAGASSVSFGTYYPWYLNINGASSVQLTGTIAAGAKYLVAYDNTDFSPNLVSTLIGTGGTTQYLLSTYGDYSSGIPIDVYNGSAPGFDFTGKHAVRHYNIVSPNPAFTGSEWVVSAAQNTDMTPGSHHSLLNWDGVPDSEWRSRNNWAEGFIPDAGHNVSITNVGAVPMITDGDNAYCHNLAIASGAGLIIESDVTTNGDGSLITYGTVTGTASVKRFLAADRYWYVSQPITSATANVFLHTWLFTYNETGSAWNPFIEDETTPLVVMKGYAVWTSSINPWHQGWDPVGDTTVAYTGTLNTGTISTPLTKGGAGWNFVGNPYPSSVDWDAAGWTKTSIVTNTYYAWTGTTYASYNGSGGTNGGTRYIPPAQGFFVQASAAGTLGVTNAVRTHSTQDFWKSDENMMNRLSMTVSNGDLNDETVIYFNENATSGLDYEYDATKLMAPASPQAYTMLADEPMAINTFNNTAQTPTVILGVNAPETGDYTISASNIESFDASTPIFLEDLLTGQKINLREMSTYAFTSGEGNSERFVVHFTEYQGISDNPLSDVNSIYAVNRDIYVYFNDVKGEISIYNILGQEISRTGAVNGLNMISVPQGNAVYIVKVITDNAAVTKKVFVK